MKAQASGATQFLLLGKRALINGWRNPLVTKGKLGQTIFFGILVGLIYLRTGNDLESVQDRQGSLFFIVVNGEWANHEWCRRVAVAETRCCSCYSFYLMAVAVAVGLQDNDSACPVQRN